MSKKNRGESAEDLAIRAQIEAFDRRMDDEAAERQQQAAAIKLEREAAELAEYAERQISAGILTGEISPSFRPLLNASTYSSYDAITRAIAAAKAATAELTTSATVPATVPSAPSQPRDETTGQFIPAPEQEQPQEIDLARLTLAEYAEQVRGRMGMDKRGIENVGRAPGHERQEFRGHTLDEGSGFPDWRDSSPNERVFDSQLPDTRRRG